MQTSLDLLERTDPMTCPLGTYYPEIDRVLCTRNGKVWTNCRASLCGEPPMCAYDEPDNSPEAVARRLEWMKHEKGTGE